MFPVAFGPDDILDLSTQENDAVFHDNGIDRPRNRASGLLAIGPTQHSAQRFLQTDVGLDLIEQN